MVDGLDETMADGAAGRATLAAGAQLGKHRLVRALGAGGMGVVWVAHDPDLDREVAIKLLRSEQASEVQRTRFLREARAMAKLKHPNVLTVHEVASSGGRDYIVMELVDGTNLDAWLATKPEPRDVWDALFAAGRGLAAAHAAGLVHRDFKPHNVLRSRDGRVLVMDFGLAADVGPQASDVAPAHSGEQLTQTGALMGTPAYMSTEQFAGGAADARSDQFAFCVTAWEALTGKRPFDGGSIEELRAATKAGVPNVDASLPRDVRAVLVRGLAPQRDQRWPDMPSLLSALDRARHAPRRRRRIAFAAFAFALAGALGVKIALRAPAAAPSPCVPDEQVFARTWEITGATEKAGRALDDVRARWLASYRRVCARPEAPAFNQRLGCLLATRDSIVSMMPLVEKFGVNGPGNQVYKLLPTVDACEGSAPPTPPQLPEDPAVRAKIADIRARSLSHTLRPLREYVEGLVAEAHATGWPPLVGEVLYVAAVDAHQMHEPDLAREFVERAVVEAAAARHLAIEARARLELVGLDFDYSLNLKDAGELARAVAEARAAISAAGGSPIDLAHLDLFAANRAMFDRHPEAAIDDLVRIRKILLDGGDFAVNPVTQTLSRAYELRDRMGDRDAAISVLRETSERARAMFGPWGDMGLGTAGVEFRRGDLDAAHREDKSTHPYNLQPTLTGVVRGPDGAAVEGARVIAWSGTLEGDSKRLDFGLVPGKLTTTDRDGRFVLLSRATAIAAEKGDLRSRPQRVADGTTLQLAPTHAIFGKVTSLDSPAIDVEAFAIISVGGDRFVERAPVLRDGSFQLARLPEGVDVVGLRDDTQTIRTTPADHVELAWPALARLDVIVGNANSKQVEVHVLRGKVAPRSPDELHALVDKAGEVTSTKALEIGDGDATDAGRALYQTGDRHRVLPHVDAGWITVCAIEGERVACVPYEVRISNVTEKRYDDGTTRHWADVNAVRVSF